MASAPRLQHLYRRKIALGASGPKLQAIIARRRSEARKATLEPVPFREDSPARERKATKVCVQVSLRRSSATQAATFGSFCLAREVLKFRASYRDPDFGGAAARGAFLHSDLAVFGEECERLGEALAMVLEQVA